MKKHVIKIKKLIEKFDLKVVETGRSLEDYIYYPTIYRTGPELMCFFSNEIEINRFINIIGKSEIKFINSRSENYIKKMFEKFFSCSFPCLIVASGAKLSDDILEIAKKKKKTILTSEIPTTILIKKIKLYLQQILSPEIVLEGHTLLELFGTGILITGYDDARIGVTLELIERGHKLIADENLIVKKSRNSKILGVNGYNKNSEEAHYYLITKTGLKSIDISNHFGVRSVKYMKNIDLVIDLEIWEKGKKYDRLGLDREYKIFFDQKIPKHVLPVKKGRNLAVIIETAALNERAKRIGIFSAQEFSDKTKQMIKEKREASKDMGNSQKISIRDIIDGLNLEIVNKSGQLENIYLENTSVHRPSLALSGFYTILKDLEANRIQLFSKVEFEYLVSLKKEEKLKNLENYMKFDFPAIIIANLENIPEYFLEFVKKYNKILLRSKETPTQFTANLVSYIEKKLAPSYSLHGVLVEIYGFGVLIVGRSGVGKSETAIELIHRGHRLVADDLVNLTLNPDGKIMGKAGKLPYFMEIRGLGIIDIKTLYGISAIRTSKSLDLIIELQDSETNEYMSKASYLKNKIEIFGKKIDKIELYMSSGRNAAAMVEIATMNILSRKMGYNPDIENKGENLVIKEEYIDMED